MQSTTVCDQNLSLVVFGMVYYCNDRYSEVFSSVCLKLLCFLMVMIVPPLLAKFVTSSCTLILLLPKFFFLKFPVCKIKIMTFKNYCEKKILDLFLQKNCTFLCALSFIDDSNDRYNNFNYLKTITHSAILVYKGLYLSKGMQSFHIRWIVISVL